ncbi:NAD-dependent epimerase/dehydratase family protein [Nocardioides sp. Bht2]|uniref:NAD-dependent epimerase/dehydratase family protein n=1 Tax=Nocardioides sp. Bht2 TaxID=3392297 RepID=UPI0039B53241
MKLLVLGGSVFLSRAVAAHAVAVGHDVVCATRGRSGGAPDGARWVAWDRDEPVPDALADETFDVVVDVARHPSRVRAAVAAFPNSHWVFVSTINVYADDATPGGTPENLPLVEPRDEDADLTVEPEAYGPMKRACELSVLDGAASATIVRPGLIVGPGDPSGRFSYWPARLADGGEVLAPGSPDDAVQVIDVRDLAAWLVLLAERRTVAILDGTGQPTTRGAALAEIARGVAVDPRLTWVDQSFLLDREVPPWMGPGSLPLWLPLPDYAGLVSHDVTASYAAGLQTRGLAETAGDTLAWLRSADGIAPIGMGREAEAELLADWQNHRA